MSSIETESEGGQVIRLAANEAEVRAAQALRYRVFYEEMGAEPTPEMAAERSDFDHFDNFCDHLVVIDPDRGDGPAGVVGTYRLMQRKDAAAAGRFYSADEFDLAPVVNFPGNILELGRSCIDVAYRNKKTMQLLWRGIAAYVFEHDIELMFGCASLHGVEPTKLALPLAYLNHYHMAPAELRVKALPERYVDMNLMPKEQINLVRGLASVPPLVKGYLRLGGFIGEGAVIDHQFNTTDVCVIVKTDEVTEKYAKHYERTAR